MRTHFHANERKCPSGVLCVFLSVHVSLCVCVCVHAPARPCVFLTCVCTSRGLWLMGSLLMLSQDYRWLQWLDTNLTSTQRHTGTRERVHAHTHVLHTPLLCLLLPPSLPTSLTHNFHLFRALTGALMRINLPTSANKVTHPDIPRSASLDLFFFFYRYAHVHTHGDCMWPLSPFRCMCRKSSCLQHWKNVPVTRINPWGLAEQPTN